MNDTYSPKSLFDLEKQVVVVTGATGILGSVYCQALASNGATVVVSDIHQEKCEQLATQLAAEYGVKAHPLAVDLSREDSIRDWATSVYATCGQVDVLLNNAAYKGPGFFSKLEEFSLQTWNDVMAVNVGAVFLSAKYIGSRMASRGSGSIINIASIYGVVGPDQRIYEGSYYEALGGAINTPMVYSASKGAVISMTRYLATYWGKAGVRVNCVTPGGVSSGQNEVFEKKYSERVPMGRMAKANEMVGAILYLSSQASSYMNGQNLIVDGGWTAW